MTAATITSRTPAPSTTGVTLTSAVSVQFQRPDDTSIESSLTASPGGDSPTV